MSMLMVNMILKDNIIFNESVSMKHSLICANKHKSGLYVSECPKHNVTVNGKNDLKKLEIFKSKKKKKIPKPIWC